MRLPSASSTSLFERDNPSRRDVLAAASGVALASCSSRRANPVSIEFTRIPKADPAGQESNDIIEGLVKGNKPEQLLVLYAHSGKWWVQPLKNQPFTKIQANSKFTNATHLGTEYAALVVNPGYRPPATLDELPKEGDDIVAIAVVPGGSKPPSATVSFRGYEWRVRSAPSSRGGPNLYDASNAWVDETGSMHLRATQGEKTWICSEVSLTRSLGYGTYRFVVRDISHLEPGMVFGMFTWDYAGGEQGNREMDIEISRWGDPASKNAQYVVQPFYVAANVSRFSAPEGRLTHELRWEAGRATFRTYRGDNKAERPSIVSERVFTSGVPGPGIESVRMNHYRFHGGLEVKAKSSEVVVEQFEYLP